MTKSGSKNREYLMWNKDSQLKFNNTLGNASKLDNEGNTFITVTSIDRVIKEKVDYIKLDIEGGRIRYHFRSKKNYQKI